MVILSKLVQSLFPIAKTNALQGNVRTKDIWSGKAQRSSKRNLFVSTLAGWRSHEKSFKGNAAGKAVPMLVVCPPTTQATSVCMGQGSWPRYTSHCRIERTSLARLRSVHSDGFVSYPASNTLSPSQRVRPNAANCGLARKARGLVDDLAPCPLPTCCLREQSSKNASGRLMPTSS
jgi:hypothetical protein